MPYVPPKYPAKIPTYNEIWPWLDDIDWAKSTLWDALVKELRAVIIELGVLPKGAYADVAARLTALSQAAIPSGMIAIWHGLIANIPAGWILCDGTNGTPNLLDKFVKGAPTATNPGATGGAASVTLDLTQIPSHPHTIPGSGTHTHPYNSGADPEDDGPYTNAVTPQSARASGAGGEHNHGGNTGNAGGGLSHENRPPYYEVAFIMKT